MACDFVFPYTYIPYSGVPNSFASFCVIQLSFIKLPQLPGFPK